MVKAGIIGLGGMGTGHLNNLIRFSKEGDVIKLIAACDIRPEAFEKKNRNLILIQGKAMTVIKIINATQTTKR